MKIKLDERETVWFTSDSHFSHSNIIRYADRPFSSVEEMDQQLIQNWNEVVKPGDYVFHLGDFGWKNSKTNKEILNQLSGIKYFVKGNHDKSHPAPSNTVHDIIDLRFGEQQIILCHYAMRVWHRSHHGSLHLYGHSHASLSELDSSRSMDVGVDSAANHPYLVEKMFGDLNKNKKTYYRPIRLDLILEYMKTKNFVPVDHHEE